MNLPAMRGKKLQLHSRNLELSISLKFWKRVEKYSELPFDEYRQDKNL